MAKRMCSFLATIMFVLMAAVSAQAYDVNNHVYEAANGVGDALIYPAYIALDTVGTKIKVINTSATYSVVAKVVFREGISSCETRDFLIFLTPNDVWYANINEVNGVTTITSNDESSPVEVPLEIGMAESCNGYDDTTGYVEIYESLAFILYRDGARVTGAIDKGILKAAYNEILGSMAAWIPVLSALDCDTDYETLPFEYDGDDYTASVYRSKSVMSGFYTIGDSTGLKIEKRAVALAHNCNAVILNVQEETRWDNYGWNRPVEVRSALSKAYIHIPFNSQNASTFAVLNWPVKLSCCPSGSQYCDGVRSACSDGEGDECKTNCEGIAPEYWVNKDCLHTSEAATSWAVNGYDNEEHYYTDPEVPFSPVPPSEEYDSIPVEVIIADLTDFQGRDLTNGYSEGWVRLALSDCTDSRSGLAYDNMTYLTYDGSAVIANFMDVDYDVALVAASYDASKIHAYCGSAAGSSLATFDNGSYQVISPDLWPWAITVPSCQ